MGEVLQLNLEDIYFTLFDHFGPQNWWPGETSEEHLAGCVLAQNTRWDRVEPVVERLNEKGLLRDGKLLQLSLDDLAELLKGTGTYHRKAEYLQNVWFYMIDSGWNGKPESVKKETSVLRHELLALKGFGPETCDCILLYVLKRPVFVVDAYTRRILSRHGLCGEKDSYRMIQDLFHHSMEPDPDLFNEYHALLVECAKNCCRPRPRCTGCPLVEGEKCL